MEYRISDLLDGLEECAVPLREEQLASATKIKELTMNKIHEQGSTTHRRARRRFTSILLAAALVVALGVTAYAGGLFRIRLDKGEPLEYTTSVWNEETQEVENVTGQIKLAVVFSYEGDGKVYEAEFRPGWLPEERGSAQIEMNSYEPGGDWYYYVNCDLGQDLPGVAGLPYQITLHYAKEGYQMFLLGEGEIVKEDVWGDYRVVEVETTNLGYRANYVLLLDEQRGWIVSVAGEEELEVLEHIARELELRPTEYLRDFSVQFTEEVLFLGRG